MKSKNSPKDIPQILTPQTLFPTEKIIELAQKAGVDFGSGSPAERIRYYIKLGLLPHAIRRSTTTGSAPVGHLPHSTVKRLLDISRLYKQGYTYQQIAEEIKKEEAKPKIAEWQKIPTSKPQPAPKVLPSINLFPKVGLSGSEIDKKLDAHAEKISHIVQSELAKTTPFIPNLSSPRKGLGFIAKGAIFTLLVTSIGSGLFYAGIQITNRRASQIVSESSQSLAKLGEVLAATSGKHRFYVDADSEFSGTTLFRENITAPNIIYSVGEGTGIDVTPGQNPIVSLEEGAVVESINDLAGVVTLTGSGATTVSTSGSTITVSSTSAAEADTLATVTGRGSTTGTASSFTGGLTVGTSLTFSDTAGIINLTNAGTLTFRDGTNPLFRITDQGTYGFIGLSDKGSTGDPATCTAGDIYFNGTDTTFKGCTATNTWQAFGAIGSTATLQGVYDNDTNGSDAIIALTSADDSLIFRNPASGGTDSGYILSLDQLATGAVDSLRITNAGAGSAGLTATHSGTSGTNYAIYSTASTSATTNYALYTANGNVSHILGASDKVFIDGSTTANTGTAGVLDINVTTATSGASALNISTTHTYTGGTGDNTRSYGIFNDFSSGFTAGAGAATHVSYGFYNQWTNAVNVTSEPGLTGYGIYNIVTKSKPSGTSASSDIYGIYSKAIDSGCSACDGPIVAGMFEVVSQGGSSGAYGVYGTATGAGTNRAGFFLATTTASTINNIAVQGTVSGGTGTSYALYGSVVTSGYGLYTHQGSAVFDALPPLGTVRIDGSTTVNAGTDGVLDINVTSLSHQSSGINLSYTSTALGDDTTVTQYGIYSAFANTQAVTATSPAFNFYGEYLDTRKSGADSLTTGGTFNTYGVVSDARNTSTDTSAAGTRNTYAGYFTATGAAAGTTNTYGVYTTAASADNNYALYVAAGNINFQGLSASSGTSLCVNGSSNVVTCGASSGANTLQGAYDNDVDGSDAIIALTTADDSLIFRNPASGGTDSGYILSLDQLATGAVDSLRITNAGTSSAALTSTHSGSTGTNYALYSTTPTTATTNYALYTGNGNVSHILGATNKVYIDATTTTNTQSAGVLDIDLTTSASTDASALNISTTSTSTSFVRGFGIYNNWVSTAANTFSTTRLYGLANVVSKTGADSGSTREIYGLLSDLTFTGAADSGTRRTFAGVFKATADTAGTGTAYGVYGTASGADNNYGLFGTTTGAGTANFGIYGNATGATTNYGLYVAAGNVNFQGLSASSGTSLCVDGSSNVVTCAAGSGSSTLQSAYDADADGSDAIIALTTADDSLIFRNPASGGTDSAFVLSIDQLAADATGEGGLSVSTTNTATTGNTTYGTYSNWSSSAVVTGSTTHTGFGVFGRAAKTGADTSTGSVTMTGVYGFATNTGSTDAGTRTTYGGRFQANGDTNGTSTIYGVHGIAGITGSTGDNNYGGFFTGRGNSSGEIAVGVYGIAFSASTNYSLYSTVADTAATTYALYTAAGNVSHILQAPDKVFIDGSTTPNTGTAGVLDVNVSSVTNGNKAVDINYTWTNSSVVTVGYGMNIQTTRGATGANSLYGLNSSFSTAFGGANNGIVSVLTNTSTTASPQDTAILGQVEMTGLQTSGTFQGIGVRANVSKTGADTTTSAVNLYGVYGAVDYVNAASGGTKNTFAGYFTATGGSGGTSKTYGIYGSATGADINYGAYFVSDATLAGGGNTGIRNDFTVNTAGSNQNNFGYYGLTTRIAASGDNIYGLYNLLSDASVGSINYGQYNLVNQTNASASAGTVAYGGVFAVNDASTSGNSTYGLRAVNTITGAVTGTSQRSVGLYGQVTKTGADTSTDTTTIYGTIGSASNTGSTAAGTKNTYGGFFSATGDASGTTNAYGISLAASGADNNFGLYGAAISTAGSGTNYGLFFGQVSGANANYGIYGSISTDGVNNAALRLATTDTRTTGFAGSFANYGIVNLWTSSAVVTGSSTYRVYGNFTNVQKTGADTNTSFELISAVYGIASLTGSTDTGTRLTYGGHFSAVGDTSGTSTAYGVHTDASGADNNYGLWVAAGNVNIQGLTASSSVYTDANKNLTTSAPTSGADGYWTRSGTTLSPTNSGDDVTLQSGGDFFVVSGQGLDTSAAGTLNIGTTNATTINIGDTGGGSTVNINTGAPTAGAVNFGELGTVQTYTVNSAINTTAHDVFTISVNNNSTGSGTQNIFKIVQNITGGTDTTNAAILIDNADTSSTNSTIITDAIRITNSGGISGGITNGIMIGTGTQSITNGLVLGSTGITTDITLQNGETIENDTDGTVLIEDGGSTTLISASTSDLKLNLDDSLTFTARVCASADGSTGVVDIGDCAALGQTDLAEYYGTDGSLEAGTLVSGDRNAEQFQMADIGHASKAWVKASASAYDPKVIGVISTNPYSEILGQGVFSEDEHPKPVALSGRVPIKVSGENGPIKAGDPLTSSSTPGVGMLATKAGRVIGTALESYNCSQFTVDSSQTGTENSEPTTENQSCLGTIIVFVNPSYYIGANLASNGSMSSQFSVDGSQNEATVNSELLTDNQIDRFGILVESGVYDGQILTADQVRHLVEYEVDKKVKNLLASGQLFPTSFGPYSPESGIRSPESGNSCEQTTEPSPLPESTASAEATSSGSSVTSDSVEESICTGQALADQTGQTLDALNALLQTTDYELNTLRVGGRTQLADTQLAGTFSQDGTLIIDYGRQINVLGSTLYLQNDDLAGGCEERGASLGSTQGRSSCNVLVDIGAGSATFDKEGNIKITGTLSAQKVETMELAIDTTDTSKQSLGSGQIRVGQTQVTIATTAVEPNTKILVTPTTPTGGKALYIAAKNDFENFTVAVDTGPALANITFDWLIVNTKQISQSN